MLKIIEISSEEKFNEKRANEDSSYDYFYILKYCGQIKVSDNGTLRNFTNIQICNSLDEYNSITEKDNIVYIVEDKVYIKDLLLAEIVTDESLDTMVQEIVNLVDGTGDDTK